MNILQFQKSKWKQANLLKTNALTKSAVPATTIYTKANLFSFLSKYDMVYLKPDGGGQGRGVIRVTQRSRHRYIVQLAGNSTVVNSSNALENELRKTMRGKKYVIQQAIPSATTDGRPFDVRVHVQRLNDKWVVGGMVGKVGNHGEIVTNRHRGGKPVSIDKLLWSHLDMDRKNARRAKRILEELSIETAKAMQKGYPFRREYGIDIGMDEQGNFWIYEANITPGIHIFKDLSDQSAYRRILRYRRLRKRKSTT